MLGRLTGSGKNPALPRFQPPDHKGYLIRGHDKASSFPRGDHIWLVLPCEGKRANCGCRFAPPLLMCPTRHVKVTYCLRHHLVGYFCIWMALLIRGHDKASSFPRGDHIWLVLPCEGKRANCGCRFAPPLLMCPTRHVKVTYCLRHHLVGYFCIWMALLNKSNFC